MKTNKKAILGFAVAMIFSLAFMQGINQKSIKQHDCNMQQVGAGCAYAASQTEGGTSAVLSYTANVAGSTCAGMATVGAGAALLTTTNPVGWGYWVATGVVGL